MDTRPVNVNLLRPVECPHNRDRHRIVSDCVIHQDSKPDFGPGYEIARLVIVCTACGWPVEVRDVERDLK